MQVHAVAERWTVTDVIAGFPGLGLVIDLTKAEPGRFYDPSEVKIFP